jgi:hypothetical protein
MPYAPTWEQQEDRKREVLEMYHDTAFSDEDGVNGFQIQKMAGNILNK